MNIKTVSELSLVNSKIFTGSGRDPPPMTIKEDINKKEVEENNELSSNTAEYEKLEKEE